MFFDRSIDSKILKAGIFVNYSKFGANKMSKAVNDKVKILIHLCTIKEKNIQSVRLNF
jgi:hypothetical protein